VSLKGYEAQVFLDIHEREDGEGGAWSRRWSRLNHELNGRGVPDPDAAAADIFLGAVYRPFTEIFTPQRVQALETAVESADSGGLAALLEEFMTPIVDFVETAVEYLDGAGGNYEPFVYPVLTPALKKPAGTVAVRENAAAVSVEDSGDTKQKAAAAACAMAQFSAFLERLIGIKAGPVAEALRPVDAAAGDAGTGSPEIPAPRRELTAYTLGYGILTLLRAIFKPELPGKGAAALALLNHWQLDRKLRDCFRGLGFKDGESWRTVEIMKALLGRTCVMADMGAADTETKPAKAGKTKTKKTAKARPAGKTAAIPERAGAAAAALIAENYQAGDFRQILGVNRFNDITWFNKEAFEESLFYLSCFLLTENESSFGPAFAGGTERAALIAEFDRVMLKAEESSGYRLDELIKALSGM
jgi:septal ring-binding cell division protein DamX